MEEERDDQLQEEQSRISVSRRVTASLQYHSMSLAEKAKYAAFAGGISAGVLELFGAAGPGLGLAALIGFGAGYWSEELQSGIVKKVPRPRESDSSRQSKLSWWLGKEGGQESVTVEQADEVDISEVNDDSPASLAPASNDQCALSGYDLLVANSGSNDILLGHDKEGREIRRTWKQLKAILILGLQGGGKTSSAVWLMSQALMQGARLAIIDKHAKSEEDSLMQKIEPFRPFFDCSPGVDPVSASQVVRHVRQVFNARLDGAPCSYPLLLVIDEFSAIMRQIKEDGSKWQEVAKELASLIEALNEEGRKHKVYAVCIGQATNASRSGGTEVRDLFNTRIAHGMREKQAEMLSLTDYKKAIRALEVGQALVDMEGRDEPFFLQVPYLSDEDIKALAEFLRANNVKASAFPAGENAVMDAVIAVLRNLDKKDLMSLIEQLPDRGEDIEEEGSEDDGYEEEEDEAEAEELTEREQQYNKVLELRQRGIQTLRPLADAMGQTEWEMRKILSEMNTLGILSWGKHNGV